MTRRAVPPTRPNVSSNRETVESFVFVFLFFCVLSVEAEGFVIPTGSMAPTLLGRQKELDCPQCGARYNVNVDREVNAEPGPGAPPPTRIVLGVCDNCRAPAPVADLPNFQGDRIYVMKTPLDIPFLPALGRVVPERWDVAVFRLPENPEVRYIKRLVGLPDETLRIQRGDLFVRPRDGDGEFRRPGRPLVHQEAMQVRVHDDAHRAAALGPEWARWSADPAGSWVESPAGTYQTGQVAAAMAVADRPPEGDDGWSTLVYRHVVPDPAQWSSILQGLPLPHPPRPTLVTDFYAYNTDTGPETAVHPTLAMKPWRQPHWVGDLTLAATIDVIEASGTLRLELVKAGVINRCEVDLATGEATLWHGEIRLAGPVRTDLGRPGRHPVSFANVDDRLTLRVGSTLPFGEGVRFDPAGRFAPDAEDLAPVRVAARGASVAVRGLRLSRDIYYSLEPSRPDLDALALNDPLPTDPVAFFDWLADPARFVAFGDLPPRDFEIGSGCYMALGDNSPWSRDGRAWERTDQRLPGGDPTCGWDDSGRESWEVPESLMIGKAFTVYWPHLTPVWPGWRFGPNVRLPARPTVERMRWIR